MEKKIELIMKGDKSIKILVDGEVKKNIPLENRKINAEEIYNLLNYSKGDIYTINKINDENIDAPVLNFFEELMKDIVDHINKIS